MRLQFLAIVGALCVLPLHSLAEVRTYDFTAQIASMFEHDAQTNTNTTVQSSTLPGSPFNLGDSIIGQFSYDTAAQPIDVPGLSVGYQVYSNAVPSFTFTVLSTGFRYDAAFGTGSNIILSDSSKNPDQWDVFAPFTSAAYSPITYQGADLNLFDSSGTALKGFVIPDALALSAFHYAALDYGWLRQVDGDQFHFTAMLQTLTPVTSVPEPTPLMLATAGLLVLLVTRRNAFTG